MAQNAGSTRTQGVADSVAANLRCNGVAPVWSFRDLQRQMDVVAVILDLAPLIGAEKRHAAERVTTCPATGAGDPPG
jgi:hypothetical protein